MDIHTYNKGFTDSLYDIKYMFMNGYDKMDVLKHIEKTFKERKIGRRVEIVDAGGIYKRYYEMAQKLGLTSWKEGLGACDGDTGTLINYDVTAKSVDYKHIVGVRLDKDNREIIIGSKYIKDLE